MKAVILHGTQGSPDGNWFRWLEGELTKRGWRVWLPTLPNAAKPSLREEADFVRANVPFALDDKTVIVGHSSGATLALVLAQELSASVHAIVCVSTVKDNDTLKWEPNDRLLDVPFDFARIHAHAGKLVFIHSDNDPYVPLSHANFLAEQTGGELIVLPGQGHFNLEKSAGYKTFPKLLDSILEKAA